MANVKRIKHPIPPTFDERSRVLVLGSIPSPASRELGFNYGHPRNRFWQVLSELAGEPLPTTNERKRDFCLRHHIALWDVLAECDIEGASDASIRNAAPNRLTDITQAAPIEAVFCTGAKAYDLYNKLCADEVGIPAVKLPSTSPANAACKLNKLKEAYAAILEHAHEFIPPTLDVADVVKLEQTIAAQGTSLRELMERAGAAIAFRTQQILADIQAKTDDRERSEQDEPAAVERCIRFDQEKAPFVTILCGNGNNGGDGWVAAKLLAQAGIAVRLVTTKLPDQLSAQPARDAAIEALDILEELGGCVVHFADGLTLQDILTSQAPSVLVDDGSAEQQAAIERAIQQSRIIVDAILGTGSKSNPRPPFTNWITAVNQSRENHVVLAVDVPSGISAQTGDLLNPRIQADETLTMIVRKPGLTTPECGQVRVAPLAYIEPLI